MASRGEDDIQKRVMLNAGSSNSESKKITDSSASYEEPSNLQRAKEGDQRSLNLSKDFDQAVLSQNSHSLASYKQGVLSMLHYLNSL